MSKEAENKGLKVKIVIKDVITQGDLEKFEAAYYAMDTKTISSNSSALVKSALEAGWIEINGMADLTPESILEADARAIRFIGEEVAKLYTEFTTVPKN